MSADKNSCGEFFFLEMKWNKGNYDNINGSLPININLLFIYVDIIIKSYL